MHPLTWQRRRAALDQVELRQQRKAAEFAAEVRELAELDEAYGGDEDVLMELAGTARMGQGRAAGELVRATRLVRNFPRALDLLEAGLLLVPTAQLLLALTKNCSDAVQAEVGRRLLDRIAPLDAADARTLVAATVVEVEAAVEQAAAEQRQAKARANRGVWVFPVQDGMARIGAEVDQLSARRWALDFEELVRAQQVLDDRNGVLRTQAQRRADVFAELPARHLALLEALRRGQADALLAQALAGVPTDLQPVEPELPFDLAPAGPIRCWHVPAEELAVQLLRLPVRRPTTLNVHVPMSTLLDLDDRPAIVDGLGPMPAERARYLVPSAGLRQVMVNPKTGLPFHVGRTTHPPIEVADGPHHRPPPDENRPPAETHRERLLSLMRPLVLARRPEPQYGPSTELRTLVQTRDVRCTGPGCARTAAACELDHETPYAEGGPTAEWNLSAKSPRCHHAKHDDWDVTRDPDTGVTTWTSPLGSSYQRLPAWQPHRPLPECVQLPAPRLARLPVADTDYPEDRPLWPAPTVVEPPPPPAPKKPARGWDTDGPVPF